MKKMFFVLSMINISLMAISQNDTVRINFYSGIIGSQFWNLENSEANSQSAKLRVGATLKQKIYKNLMFNGALGYDPGAENSVITRAYVEARYQNGLGFSLGYSGTPTAKIKPYFLTVDGQFMFKAEAMAPGGALGGSLYWDNFIFGVYSRNDTLECQFGYITQKLSMATWAYGPQFWGITSKLNFPFMYMMATATYDGKRRINEQSVALSIKPMRKIPIRLIWDFGTVVHNGNYKISDNFVGFLYPLETKLFSAARFGGGYDFYKKSIGVFFLVGLNHTE